MSKIYITFSQSPMALSLFVQEEDCSVSEGIDDYDTYYSFNDDDVDAGLGYSRDSYSNLGGSGDGRLFNNNDDPEYFAYECLTIENVEQFFAEKISAICTACKVLNIHI